jgi:hypothetical protein
MDIFNFIQRFTTCVFKKVSLKAPNNLSLYSVASTPLPNVTDNIYIYMYIYIYMR